MNDPLRNLLMDADARAATPGRLVPDLPQRVYRRHRRKRIIRSGALVVLLLSVALSGLLLQRVDTGQMAEGDEATTQPDFPRPGRDVQLVALNVTADVHARTAAMLRAGERRRDSMERSQVSLARIDPTVTVRRERNRFALARVAEADRLAGHPDGVRDAVKIYRRTIELFPDTPAADIAAKRLEHTPKT